MVKAEKKRTLGKEEEAVNKLGRDSFIISFCFDQFRSGRCIPESPGRDVVATSPSLSFPSLFTGAEVALVVVAVVVVVVAVR